jgi:hypothetical protein
MIEVGVLPASNQNDPPEERVPEMLEEMVPGNTTFETPHETRASTGSRFVDDKFVRPSEVDMGIEYSDHDSELSIASSDSSNALVITMSGSNMMVHNTHFFFPVRL